MLGPSRNKPASIAADGLRLPAAWPIDRASHADLDALTAALLAGDGDIRSRAGNAHLEHLSVVEFKN